MIRLEAIGAQTLLTLQELVKALTRPHDDSKS